MLLLQYVIHKTKVGKAMRAVSLDRDAAELMGIDINKTISNTFAIGSALAGAAGVLVGIYYNSINPLMGVAPGLKAFVAAVIGGIGIVPGAVFGGFFSRNNRNHDKCFWRLIIQRCSGICNINNSSFT